MSDRCGHVAITVPALKEAGEYYRELFDVQVVTREIGGDAAGRWLQLQSRLHWS